MAQLATATGVAIVCVSRMNKTVAQSAIYRTTGTPNFANFVQGYLENGVSEMKHWQFKRGEFVEIDEFLIWKDGEDFDLAMANNGYESRADFQQGDPEGCYMATYKKMDGDEWIGEFSTGGEVHSVHLPDLPSWLMFIKGKGGR